jgi:phospholipid/cholesterol/gamma-HCH transport system substrate-binding protein
MSHRTTTSTRLLIRGAMAACVVVIIFAAQGSNRPHIFVLVSNAVNVSSGQDIRLDGLPVGDVASVAPAQDGRAAKLELEFDSQAWPLHRGVRMDLRWGGTLNYANRYIALQPGSPQGATLRAGGTYSAADVGFQAPVEYDQLIGTFTPSTRRGLKSLLENLGPTLATAAPSLHSALGASPPALQQTGQVLEDLATSDASLNALLVSTDRVVNAVQTANPGVGSLVSSAATTFSAVAAEARPLQQTLSDARPALVAAQTLLRHAVPSLQSIGHLAVRINPGITQLRHTAAPLNDVLQRIEQVGPDAESTLAAVRTGAPAVDTLLRTLTSLAPELGAIGSQAAVSLKCIRPYTPDIAAFFSDWGDFGSWSDGKDKYLRAGLTFNPAAGTNAQLDTSAQAIKAYPGESYAFPSPPGYFAGQPWFLPQCGAGRDALNPAGDPESRPFNPLQALSRVTR